jgi:hypothetical protein
MFTVTAAETADVDTPVHSSIMSPLAPDFALAVPTNVTLVQLQDDTLCPPEFNVTATTITLPDDAVSVPVDPDVPLDA